MAIVRCIFILVSVNWLNCKMMSLGEKRLKPDTKPHGLKQTQRTLGFGISRSVANPEPQNMYSVGIMYSLLEIERAISSPRGKSKLCNHIGLTLKEVLYDMRKAAEGRDDQRRTYY